MYVPTRQHRQDVNRIQIILGGAARGREHVWDEARVELNPRLHSKLTLDHAQAFQKRRTARFRPILKPRYIPTDEHVADVELIAQYTHDVALSQSWCPDFDTVVLRLRDRLYVAWPERMYRPIVQATLVGSPMPYSEWNRYTRHRRLDIPAPEGWTITWQDYSGRELVRDYQPIIERHRPRGSAAAS